MADVLDSMVARLNGLYELASTRRAYINGFVATDSRNTEAAKALSAHEQVAVKLEQISLKFRSWVGSIAPVLDAALTAAAPTETGRGHTPSCCARRLNRRAT